MPSFMVPRSPLPAITISGVTVDPPGQGFMLERAFTPSTLDPGEQRSLLVGYMSEATGEGTEVTWNKANLLVTSPTYTEPLVIPMRAFSRALSCEGLRVSLVWSTAGDPDTKDTGPEAGADMDLHLRHPFAVDWFDLPFDAFWSNASPAWGDMQDPHDDPQSGPDDMDGLGPEEIVIPIPESDVTYRVGVHYWDDNFYGPSTVQVQVFVFGALVHQTPLVSLDVGALWEALDIRWSAGRVDPIQTETGAYLVHSDYRAPCTPKACPD